jgi:methionyl-tRNA formyltransferase
MRIVIAGQKEFGAAVFRLAKRIGHDIVAVSCPDRNTSGDALDRLHDAAKTYGVKRIPSLSAEMMPDDIDLIVTAHSHDFIGRKTRDRARWGAVGYHPSLLPRHRGRDAVRWALKMGDPITGGSIYWLNEVMDGGPIAAQKWCWIEPGETAESLWREKLFPIGLELFQLVLSDVERHFQNKERQNANVATFEPACNPPRAFRPDLLRIGHRQHPVELMGP